MSTFADLIAEVENYLYSYGMQRDKVTTLTSPITTSDTTLNVADARQVDRGLLEIDQELMAVSATDYSSGVVTLHPWGRGQRGTTPAAHAGNSKVVLSPRFPRSAIANAVQRTIQSMYPDLYQVLTDETNVAGASRITYPVPANADSIISVSYEPPGVTHEWERISRWRLVPNANIEDFPSGKAIDITQGILPGRPIRIAYRAGFGTFTGEGASLSSIGCKDRWADLIVFGAAASMVLSMEAIRLESDAVETQERAGAVQPTQATTVARQLLGMFKTRITEERSLLHRQHPAVLTRQL